MKNNDRDEKLIYSKLNNIKVDNSKIKRNVMDNLRTKEDKKSKSFIASSLVAVMSLLLIVGVSAATIKNSEWFINKFNPIFKEIVEPVDIYAEDKGLRMEIIAGKKYDNKAIVYLSIQDMTGNNRITENTDIKDGLFLKLGGSSGSYGVDSSIVNFDKETSTIYYQLIIDTDTDSVPLENFKIGTSKIYFDSTKYEDELMEISSDSISKDEDTYIEESKIWGSSNTLKGKQRILEPGRFSSMPHGDESQWISNVGLIDGKLHIQIASGFNESFGPSGAYFTLEDGNDKKIECESSLIFVSDMENNILEVDEISADLEGYKYKEYIFPMVEYQELYKIYYSGDISYGVDGNWQIETNLRSNEDSIFNLDKTMNIGTYNVDNLKLSPLDLELALSYTDAFEDDLSLKLRTSNGLIDLENGEVTKNNAKSEVNIKYIFDKPILIEDVEGIIINNIEIEIR